MPLRWEDFTCTRINWDEKNLSIKSIASELNLSLDSVVFIDDSPIERKKILELLPEVTVLPLEVSPVLRPSQILDFVELWKSELTSEDFSRTHQYSLEVSRKNLIEREDREENSWLEDLDIFIEINELNEMNVIRASQLANKTNQMNLATRG
jgi:FkbH-like protein